MNDREHEQVFTFINRDQVEQREKRRWATRDTVGLPTCCRRYAATRPHCTKRVQQIISDTLSCLQGRRRTFLWIPSVSSGSVLANVVKSRGRYNVCISLPVIRESLITAAAAALTMRVFRRQALTIGATP